jgi:hypothetical protein
MMANLLHFCVLRCVATQQALLSPFRLCVIARRVVALLLGLYKWVGFLSCCRMTRCCEHESAKRPILTFEPSGNVWSRQNAMRQCAVWHVSLTTGRQGVNLPFGALSCLRQRQRDAQKIRHHQLQHNWYIFYKKNIKISPLVLKKLNLL